MNVFEMFKEDWQRMPLSYRYFFLAGMIFIIMVWIRDHWGGQKYTLWGLDYGALFFSIGLTLIIVALCLMVVTLVRIFARIELLKRKYPKSRLNLDFHLVALAGWIYLFDLRTKERFHIKNPQTIWDLGFDGEWTSIAEGLDKVNTINVKGGVQIHVNEFHEVVGGIRTQG